VNGSLEVQGLRYSYRGIRAVSDVSLRVGTDEIVALVGANGAGKSTSVKMIAGALRPESGHISWDGADITGLPAHRVVERGMTFVPEGRLVFQALTVEENLRSRARCGACAARSRGASTTCSRSSLGRAPTTSARTSARLAGFADYYRANFSARSPTMASAAACIVAYAQAAEERQLH
jgi:ABC-type multidrug transport system ATPase subunit